MTVSLQAPRVQSPEGAGNYARAEAVRGRDRGPRIRRILVMDRSAAAVFGLCQSLPEPAARTEKAWFHEASRKIDAEFL